LPAYSEFMPAPRLGRKPLGDIDLRQFSPDDPWGWTVTEYEETLQLRPGLQQLGTELVQRMRHLGQRRSVHGIAANKLRNNPYWPDALHEGGAPETERFVLLAPLALSRTQDDKGRVRWSLLGGSEIGPARPFWRGFFSAPDRERPISEAHAFLSRLLGLAYGVPEQGLREAGLRILPIADQGADARSDEGLPSWVADLRFDPSEDLRRVRYLLTFRAFALLPEPVQRAYLTGRLALLPFPGSLLFWGVETYHTLAQELASALQIPLLQMYERHEGPRGLRVSQSGWLHEPRLDQSAPDLSHGPYRNTYRRTHRWAKVHRDEDELAITGKEDRVAHVLFSAAANDLGLYGKPMARNAQIWTPDGHLLLDGPRARRIDLDRAARRLGEGGQFGYRFLYPPMRVGRHEVVWHRPLVACSGPAESALVFVDGSLGSLTATVPGSAKSEELWPRILDRPEHVLALAFHPSPHTPMPWATVNARKVLDTADDRGPLEPSFARSLLTLPREESLETWLEAIETHGNEPERGEALGMSLRARLGDDLDDREFAPLTFDATAKRSYELAYWNLIADLATGRFVTKDNADCVLDPVTQERLPLRVRDLDALADYLVTYYQELLRSRRNRSAAMVGEFPFHWRTDFDYVWSGGWMRNREGESEERDIVMVIPGRDRSRAIVMADHYDTAYMEDVYGYGHGGGGPRLAAAGADDNHSATATLMLAAPIFLDLAKAGKLECDIWLVHLTGEEFPSDCLGARHLAASLVEGRFGLRDPRGRHHDFSGTKVEGVYVLDMVAHNNDHVRDVFQICPGVGSESLGLAYQAHLANRMWNLEAPDWNRRHRRGCRRGKRVTSGRKAPKTALHPKLHGEVRLAFDPRSTLYNTDGQIFSDLGIPVVLFMENYDINRHGYHDSHDTLENIDLDYGSALSAIAIEAVARAASNAPLPRLAKPKTP
jgi:hypothetical protein